MEDVYLNKLFDLFYLLKYLSIFTGFNYVFLHRFDLSCYLNLFNFNSNPFFFFLFGRLLLPCMSSIDISTQVEGSSITITMDLNTPCVFLYLLEGK